jgi:hypothetical protein
MDAPFAAELFLLREVLTHFFHRVAAGVPDGKSKLRFGESKGLGPPLDFVRFLKGDELSIQRGFTWVVGHVSLQFCKVIAVG